MSLIHQALRDMEPPLAADAALLAPRAAPAPSRSRRVPVLALVAALAVAAAGAAGWYALNAGRPPAARTASVAPPPAIIPTAAAASLQSALVAQPQPASALLPVPQPRERAALPAPVRVADAATVPDPPPARPAAEPTRSVRPAHAPVQATPVQSSPLRTTAAARPMAVAPPPAAMPVEQRFNAFLQAMRTGDMPGAGQHLAALRRDLPPGSVSLLRAEGWYALAGGDADAAARIYQDLLDRLPGDEEASINLASIEARRQRGEAARKILADAVRVHPESESLKSALARFQAKP